MRYAIPSVVLIAALISVSVSAQDRPPLRITPGADQAAFVAQVAAYEAEWGVEPTSVEQLEAIFGVLDTDGDDLLSATELQRFDPPAYDE